MLADNASAFTLDGTRTYLIGERRVALVDPGPDHPGHVDRLLDELRDAERVDVLLTHGHGDHAGGLERLVHRLDAAGMDHVVVGVGHELARPLDRPVTTDRGRLSAIPTPGHSREHLAFLWEEPAALFVGDLMLGRGDTTWVGEYPGCVADYLESLVRVEGSGSRVLLPAHGPPIHEPRDAVERYREHRIERIEQARRARSRWPDASVDELLDLVYPDVPSGLRRAALMSLGALVEYVEDEETEGR